MILEHLEMHGHLVRQISRLLKAAPPEVRASVLDAIREHADSDDRARAQARIRQARRRDSHARVTLNVTPNITPNVTQLDNVVVLENLETENRNGNNRNYKEEAVEVLKFLNKKTGKNFRSIDTNLKLIRARLQSGASIQDCFSVIIRQDFEWKSTEMEKYLRPATLFNSTKFEQYLGEIKRNV